MQGSIPYLSRLGIRGRILAGFGVPLALMGVVGGTAALRLEQVGQAFGTFRHGVVINGNAAAIDRDFLGLRMNLREFGLTGREANAVAASELAAQVGSALDKAIAGTRMAHRRKSLQDMRSAFTEYREGMQALIALRTEQDRLMHKELDPNGQQLRTGLDALATAFEAAGDQASALETFRALETLMLARLHANKMIGRHDPTVAAEAEKSLAQLRTALDSLAQATRGTPQQSLLDEAIARNAAYTVAFGRMVSAAAELDRLLNRDLRAAGEALMAAAAATKESVMADLRADEEQAQAAITQGEVLLAAVSLGGIGLGILLAWLIGRGIARPVTEMAGAMRSLAEGRLDTAIPAADRTDEIGRMAQAVLVFRDTAVATRRLEASATAQREARERRQAAMTRHTQDFGASISAVMSRLARAAEGMRDAAARMSENVDLTEQQAAGTAAGAVTSSQNLGTVAAAVEELTASSGEIAQQVVRAAGAARAAVGCTRTTDEKVRSLTDAAQRIGEVVDLISSIAGQTNLLALNAAIEAARAGEAGKGFAVVANEVKTLAAATEKATGEVAQQVEAIRSATAEAAAAVRQVNEAIDRVDEVAAAIAAAIEEQGTATREIAANVHAVANATRGASHAMQQVAQAAQGGGETSRSVLRAAAEVGDVSISLRGEVDHFLGVMASEDGEDRRRYERIPGAGLRARLRIGDRDLGEGEIHDISRGGIGIRHAARCEIGDEVLIELPRAGAPVPARVIRIEGGLLALAFHHNGAVLSRVDATLAAAAAANGQAAA